MNTKQLLTCPFCGAGQGEIDSRITYRRKRGAVHFEPKGEFQLDCYACGESSRFEKDEQGNLISIK